MGVLLQNDQPVGGISADVIETINFSDLTTTSKTLPGAINELAANPSTTESMSQAEYNALTEAEKMDGTARFVYDAISTDESELWTRVGRNTLHTDAQIISNAINEIKDTMGSGTLTTTSPTIIGGINELNSRFIDYIVYRSKNLGSITMQANATGSASYNLDDVTGYKPIGILGYTGSGTTGTVLQECYMSGTTGYVYLRNMTSSQKTVSNVTLNVLYVKIAS